MAKRPTPPGNAASLTSGRPTSVFINQAQSKLQFFNQPDGVSIGKDRIVCVHRFGFTGRKAMGSRIPGLSEAKLKGTTQGESYLSSETIQILGTYLGFDPEWPEWKTGSAEAFAKKYNADNTYRAKEFHCERVVNAAHVDPSLGTVNLRVNANLIALPLRISVNLSCGEAPEGDMTIWIKAAQLRVTIGKSGRTVDIDDRKRFPESYPDKAKDAPGCALKAFGDDNAPYWDMQSSEACFGALTLGDFIEVAEIEDGDDVVIELWVYVGDLVAIPTEGRGADREQRRGDTQAVRWVLKGGGSVPQLSAKAAIAQRLSVRERIERLQKQNDPAPIATEAAVGKLGTDRYLLLATHRLTFKSASAGK